MKNAMTGPVTPKLAASLVLCKGPLDRPSVLMGRRHRDLRFMPGVWVFPGGALEQSDGEQAEKFPINDAVKAGLARAQLREDAYGLPWAAIRETWEETQLLYGTPAVKAVSQPPHSCSALKAFDHNGLDPLTNRLDLVARAVTPPEISIRFDSFFFLGDGDDVIGTPTSTGELEDVGWVDAAFAAATYRIAPVTQYVLSRAVTVWAAAGGAKRVPQDRAIPLFTQQADGFSAIDDDYRAV